MLHHLSLKVAYYHKSATILKIAGLYKIDDS